jgi:glucokinase
MSPAGLIADIGGTNARFALVPEGATEALFPLVLPCCDYAGPAEAAKAYLARIAPEQRPRRAAFAIASPVIADRVTMTNHVWDFSIRAVGEILEMNSFRVVNDFTAVALAVPLLGDDDKVQVGGGLGDPNAPIAVLGPGTGLGVAALVPVAGSQVAVPTEGGHVTMAAATEREAQILGWLRPRFDHISAERLVSGPGLVNIHCALRGLAGLDEEKVSPVELSHRALAGNPLAVETLDTFFAMLGTVAGNLALSLGALGGVVIAGGIVPQLLPSFLASGFRTRFEDKGRFRAYLRPIPVHVVTHSYPAFVGLAGLVN